MLRASSVEVDRLSRPRLASHNALPLTTPAHTHTRTHARRAPHQSGTAAAAARSAAAAAARAHRCARRAPPAARVVALGAALLRQGLCAGATPRQLTFGDLAVALVRRRLSPVSLARAYAGWVVTDTVRSLGPSHRRRPVESRGASQSRAVCVKSRARRPRRARRTKKRTLVILCVKIHDAKPHENSNEL